MVDAPVAGAYRRGVPDRLAIRWTPFVFRYPNSTGLQRLAVEMHRDGAHFVRKIEPPAREVLDDMDVATRNAFFLQLGERDPDTLLALGTRLLASGGDRYNIGSMLFALDEAGRSIPVTWIPDVIEHGSYEASMEMLVMLEEGKVAGTPPEFERVAAELRNRITRTAWQPTAHARSAAEKALACLDRATT